MDQRSENNNRGGKPKRKDQKSIGREQKGSKGSRRAKEGRNKNVKR